MYPSGNLNNKILKHKNYSGTTVFYFHFFIFKEVYTRCSFNRTIQNISLKVKQKSPFGDFLKFNVLPSEVSKCFV
jgi:hypothetical protein